MKKINFIALVTSLFITLTSFAALEQGDAAPVFKLQTQKGESFDLNNRQGQWTVLYFYPKADTPGCTKQACAFRDNIKKIRSQDAEVFGISTNSVKEQEDFAKKHNINFTLLADEKGEVAKMYGTKMPILNISKRWTFIIGPDLKVYDLARDVDPVLDAQRVADKIAQLKKTVE